MGSSLAHESESARSNGSAEDKDGVRDRLEAARGDAAHARDRPYPCFEGKEERGRRGGSRGRRETERRDGKKDADGAAERRRGERLVEVAATK